MAFYKYDDALSRNNHDNFDKLLPPGHRPADSGIFRCRGCGREVTTEAGNPLPPQNHHQHGNGTAIQWKLIVAADGSTK